MNCEWCSDRKAEWWGKPWVGPWSRMCTVCRDRVCRRDEKGKYECVAIKEAG